VATRAAFLFVSSISAQGHRFGPDGLRQKRSGAALESKPPPAPLIY
jgi:hypothetical protein